MTGIIDADGVFLNGRQLVDAGMAFSHDVEEERKDVLHGPSRRGA